MFSGKCRWYQNLESWVLVLFSRELCDLEQVTCLCILTCQMKELAWVVARNQRCISESDLKQGDPQSLSSHRTQSPGEGPWAVYLGDGVGRKGTQLTPGGSGQLLNMQTARLKLCKCSFSLTFTHLLIYAFTKILAQIC